MRTLAVYTMPIGTASDRETAERFAEAAHVHHVVRGIVETLALVDVGHATVTTIATYDLVGGPLTNLGDAQSAG